MRVNKKEFKKYGTYFKGVVTELPKTVLTLGVRPILMEGAGYFQNLFRKCPSAYQKYM